MMETTLPNLIQNTPGQPLPLLIFKWNIYEAWVPFVDDFSYFKSRPVIVTAIAGDNFTVIPISTQTQKKQQWDLDIILKKPSIIKIGNITSIHRNHFIKPYYVGKNKKVSKINKPLQIQILENFKNMCS